MKKIMFSDKFALTKAVLEGRKTMTRRIIKSVNVVQSLNEIEEDGDLNCSDTQIVINRFSRYQPGELVAVAQNYKDSGFHPDTPIGGKRMEEVPGWTNKMFVQWQAMRHFIRITSVRVERLQDISEDDVYREGFAKQTVNNGWGNAAFHWEAMLVYYDSLGRTKELRSPNARDAFAALIDKVSGNETWESNPWVFVYEFELI